MRLLRRSDTGDFSLTQFSDNAIPPYAILSHTWGPGTEEVTFEDLTNNTGKNKPGYVKIRFCGEQAELDALQYFWIDTCCINKANPAELSQAINSMYRWYRNATRCYVYLSDVPSPFDTNVEFNPQSWDSDFWKSKWFTRGWTLQELLAPNSVEFFSYDCKRLGDKSSLEQQIQDITGVPASALQGTPLSQFSVDERFLWIERRQTSVAEDKVYSLLGIFDVEIPLFYGEGASGALKRLREVISKREKCLQELRLTDPRDDKKRIEDAKGGLLKESYRWILGNSDFQQWRNDQQSRLLWIKGDPGKGKTMLLCGIINELSTAKTRPLSYFFCQATDSRNNTATAVLRSLLYLLVNQQASLISHVRKNYDSAGKALFEDSNAWFALSEIFTNVLKDPNLNSTYLIVDALDECETDLLKLVDFIVKTTIFPRVKWIVSSRNWPSIEKKLNTATQGTRLCLELNEKSVSAAVTLYIQSKVNQLAKENEYDNNTQNAVQRYLLSNANGTFLWVALVCQELADTPGWDAERTLMTFPPGLYPMYRRMLDHICSLKYAKLCKSILALISAVYRPVTLDELASFVDIPTQSSGSHKALVEIIGLCGSFLTLREHTVSFIHQSAKDFLVEKASNEIYPSGKEETHHKIFSRSLKLMPRILRRDIYRLGSLGCSIEQVKLPYPDPLAALRYSNIYWVDHLHDWNSNSPANKGINSQDISDIENFIRRKYLYWLEALSLCRSMSEGARAIIKLEKFAQRRLDAPSFIKLLQDARQFIVYHTQAIQNSPLQVYVSALLFSPEHSLIRRYFKEEEPKWLSIKPAIGNQWSACIQTLEGHHETVYSVAFSHDSALLASASADSTIKIWDTISGKCLRTLKDLQIDDGDANRVWSIAFSYNSVWLASASTKSTVKIWDTSSGKCLQILEYYGRSVAFSHDSGWLALALRNHTIKIWDVSSSKNLWTLEGHCEIVYSVAFSHNSAWLASASADNTVKIWDTNSGKCLQTLKDDSNWVTSVAFSHNSAWLALSAGSTVTIWDASSGKCLQKLKANSNWVRSVAFSHNSAWLALSAGSTVTIWDASSGKCLQTLHGHRGMVHSVAFSHNSAWLASASVDRTVKIWDVSSTKCLQNLEGHDGFITSVTFSHNLAWLASTSANGTISVWNTSSGKCLQTLRDDTEPVKSVDFPYDSAWFASVSTDSTYPIWYHDGPVNLVKIYALLAYIELAFTSANNEVKIWDRRSGVCLRTLDVRNGLDTICLDAKPVDLHSTPRSQGLVLSPDMIWITHNSRKLVWLPLEYRPSCSEVLGNMIGIGLKNGRVIMLGLNTEIVGELN